MSKSTKVFLIASAVITSLAVAPALYARDFEKPDGVMMGSGMMSEMMEGCNIMMQSINHGKFKRPNDQWREKSPDNNETPGTNG